jgi:hypothetical protein
MTIIRSACWVACALLCTACLPTPEKLEELVPEGPKAAGHEILQSIQANDLSAIESALHSDIDPADARETLTPLLRAVSISSSFTPRFGSWQWVYQDSVGQHEFTYELEIDDGFFIVVMVFREEDADLRLAGMHFQHLSSSLIEANRFTLVGKGAIHYLFLAAGVAIPVFCLTTLVACWRRRPNRRWLWLLFIAVAFPVVTLNWSTGALSLQPLALNLLGSSFFQEGPLQPMQFQLGIPIGALVFWLNRPGARPRPGAPQEPRDRPVGIEIQHAQP